MFEVESDIPIPPGGTGHWHKYPWGDMKVGDSFFVPNPPDGQRNPAYSSVYNRGRKGDSNSRYSCRKEPGGLRVWRVE